MVLQTVNSDRRGSLLRKWWSLTGIGLIFFVVYLSLAEIYLPQVPSTIGDKINHLIAYAVLMGWFGQLFTSKRSRIILACALVLLGVAMEVGQSMTTYRFFDWLDAVANSIGVMLGVIALASGADKILPWVERRLL